MRLTHFAVLLAILHFFIVEPSCFAEANSINPDLAQIQALRQNNKIFKAIHLSLEHLKKQPNDVDVMLVLALMYYQLHDYKKAENYFSEVLEKSPTYLDAIVGLARTKIVIKQYAEAKQLINQAVQQDPTNEAVKDIQQFYVNSQKPLEKKSHPIHTSQSVKPPVIKKISKPIIDRSPVIIKEIQQFRQKNDINSALNLGLNYLKDYPNDGDVMLQVGLIYLQQKNYTQAEFYLNKVLQRSPNYTDAKIALIRVKLAKKQLKAAALLINQVAKEDPNNSSLAQFRNLDRKTQDGSLIEKINEYRQKKQLSAAICLAEHHLIENPHDTDMRLVLGNIYFQQKNYLRANYTYYYVLAQSPNNTDAKIGLINIALECGNDVFADCLTNQALALNPCNKALWVKKINVYTKQHKYAVGALLAKKLLRCDPCYKEAHAAFKEIWDINPFLTKGVNEIGIYTLNDYVSDLHSVWNYSSLHYSLDTPVGRVNAQVNYANRLGIQGYEEQLDFTPIFNQYLSVELLGKHSNVPSLFPGYTLGAEPYVSFPNFLTVSAGGLHAHIIRSTFFNRYTASLIKEIDKYWLSFRPYYFVPNAGPRSVLYTATIRRYICENDFYVNLTLGAGKSPDLSDLETLNFLVINNRFISLGIKFPLFNHNLSVDLGTDYAQWTYPSGLVRRLYGGSAGLSYRF